MPFNTTEEIIEDFRQGKMIVLVDDEGRENEGDFMMCANMTRPEDINFMARYGRGLICLTLTKERCHQLALPLMVRDNWAPNATRFTVSVDAAHGVTTGISAKDRATTILAAVAPDAKPSDLSQPGHVFPLMSEPGGVLTRAGHTEAGCDLARLAGLEPAAVIVEILNEDGTMARRPDLEVYTAEHGMKMGTIADLIHYRMLHEKTVERVSECDLPTEYGTFQLAAFQDTVDNAVHFALVKGKIQSDEPTLIRVHVRDSLCDLTGSQRDEPGWPLADALRRIAQEETGVVVILRPEERGSEIIRRINRYQQQDQGLKLPSQERDENLRTYGLGAQILLDLGVRRMRVLSAPKILHGLSGFGLEVVEYVNEERLKQGMNSSLLVCDGDV